MGRFCISQISVIALACVWICTASAGIDESCASTVNESDDLCALQVEKTHGKPKPKVDCGGHEAKKCEKCPQGHGSKWCNGDCKWDPIDKKCRGKGCCLALNVQCLSCAEGITEEEYCDKYPTTMGCPTIPPPPPVDCGGHEAPTCAECPKGEGSKWCNGDCEWVSPEGFCRGRGCCRALTAECGACSEGITVDEYCKKKPHTAGCPVPMVDCGGHQAPTCAGCPKGQGSKWCNGDCEWSDGVCRGKPCCRAATADCLACTEGITVAEYCKKKPETPGC